MVKNIGGKPKELPEPQVATASIAGTKVDKHALAAILMILIKTAVSLCFWAFFIALAYDITFGEATPDWRVLLWGSLAMIALFSVGQNND